MPTPFNLTRFAIISLLAMNLSMGCAPLVPHRSGHPGAPPPVAITDTTSATPGPEWTGATPSPADSLRRVPSAPPLSGEPILTDLPELAALFQAALQLTAEGQYDRAADQLFALEDHIPHLDQPADSTTTFHLSSLDRRRYLLGAILAEIQATEPTGAAHDSLLATSYTALVAAGLPDSLVPATGVQLDPMTADLLAVDNRAVRNWESYFKGRGRRTFQLWLDRKAAADSLIGTILAAENLPPELIYLAMIESGLSSRAVSSAGAVGPWQFMPGTAKDYGLRQNWWLDERRDLELSTRAAAHYLKDLYARFGDWALVLAAYNSGGGLVSRKIRQHGHDNFWAMRLPTQTTAYVPKFIAAAHLGQDPARYGFTVPTQKPLRYDILPVNDATDLTLIARCAGVAPSAVASLNPALLRSASPPNSKRFPVRIPAGTKTKAARQLAAVPRDKRLTWRQHRVKRGETLGGIAHTYGTSASDIARVNKMKNLHLIRPGDQLLIPMPPELVGKARQRAAENGHYVPPAGYKRVSYRVKPGDNLGGIARKLHVTIRHLRKVNNIHHTNLIHPGDRIYAYRPG